MVVVRAYSNDLREKVLGAYASGKGTLRALSERFEVSYDRELRLPQPERVNEFETGSVRV